MSDANKAVRDERLQWATKYLRKLCRPGTRIYTLISHVSRSGMTRHVRLFVVSKGRIAEITGPVASVCGNSVARDNYGLKVGGCGFGAGCDTVNSLSFQLHGQKSKGDVPSKYPTAPRPGYYQAGYSLKHERF